MYTGGREGGSTQAGNGPHEKEAKAGRRRSVHTRQRKGCLLCAMPWMWSSVPQNIKASKQVNKQTKTPETQLLISKKVQNSSWDVVLKTEPREAFPSKRHCICCQTPSLSETASYKASLDYTVQFRQATDSTSDRFPGLHHQPQQKLNLYSLEKLHLPKAASCVGEHGLPFNMPGLTVFIRFSLPARMRNDNFICQGV